MCLWFLIISIQSFDHLNTRAFSFFFDRDGIDTFLPTLLFLDRLHFLEDSCDCVILLVRPGKSKPLLVVQAPSFKNTFISFFFIALGRLKNAYTLSGSVSNAFV